MNLSLLQLTKVMANNMTKQQAEMILKLEREYDKEYYKRGLSGKLEELDNRLKALKSTAKPRVRVVGSR